MFEDFTDRSLRVLSLAKGEAKRFNHHYIGPEHIMLGLLKEDKGMAVIILANLGIDVKKVEQEIERKLSRSPDAVRDEEILLTPRAMKAIDYGRREQLSLRHRSVGTEHLLIGLLLEHDGIPGTVLTQHGLTYEKVRAEVVNVTGLAS